MTFQQTEPKELKKALQEHFSHPFSVRRDRGTAHHWINISWQDGPPESLVRQFTGKFNDTERDDLMTDLWCGSQYTAEHRDHSLAAYRWAVRQIELEFNISIKVTVIDSWKGNGEKTAYIAREDDFIVENDSFDYHARYASTKVNIKLSETDFRTVDLSGFDFLPGEYVKQDDPPQKKVESSKKMLAHYERMRHRGRYNGLPKHASFWKAVLDATSGLGLRPYRRPGGGWCELEEFLSSVPPLLRNRKNGMPPDEVAQMLHLEGGDQELYEKLQQDAVARFDEESESYVEEQIKSFAPPELASLKKDSALKFVVFERPEISVPFRFSTSKEVYEKMKGFQKADREMFIVLYLNAKNVVLNFEAHTVGAVNTSAVYPSVIFKNALLNNATSIICIHNHPSGDPDPSPSDKEITKQITFCASLLDVHLLDHIVLGDVGYYSFCDEGLISEYEIQAKAKLEA